MKSTRRLLSILLPTLLVLGACSAGNARRPSLASRGGVLSASLHPSGRTQIGEASWYGRDHQGKKTASGERFDAGDFTAAHPSLPLGSEAKVTNLENGRSVVVRVNDRGPYVEGRIIDLSRSAARQIGITQEDGTARVKVEPIR